MATDKLVMAVIRAARPAFLNDHDKAAFVVHATFLSFGYLLTATSPQALFDDALSHPSTEEVSVENWNQLDQEYVFVYVNPKKVLIKVLVKCLVMNEKLLIDALKEWSFDPAHLEICVRDYIIANERSNYSEQLKNLEQLVRRLNQDILAKLANCFFGQPRNGLPGLESVPDHCSTGLDPQLHHSGKRDYLFLFILLMMLLNDRGLFKLPVALLALAITVGFQRWGRQEQRTEEKRREDRALWDSNLGIMVLTLFEGPN
ncbi:probable proteasome inhibitor [Arachis duranensis]|uniref:Probable proteasome inhibitor n=1 Tax=Arachis duranensis TaxID=130453 RepID=A0A9C6TTI9_ARADU|nr:probable proteasome inhibitor [Arachis duranensis]